jgi:hypothetical protein
VAEAVEQKVWYLKLAQAWIHYKTNVAKIENYPDKRNRSLFSPAIMMPLLNRPHAIAKMPLRLSIQPTSG